MQKIKQVFYSISSMALLTVPAVASAQWQLGRSNAQSSGLPVDSIYSIIMRTMDWLLAILGFVGIIGFVIAGILYLTAAGNEEQIEKAKSAMMYSILGIVVALIGFVIIRAVEGWLTAGSTQF
jgi:multisubunit Na+/H+ antiporter MnhB subunit